ncbi:MAG: methyltransferase domain-containing protein [Candidatus Hodarchaeota archaeon]
MRFIGKIFLWDFVQILKKRDDLNFLEKVRVYLHEYVHKVVKIVIRNYALHKGRNFEEFIEELRKKGTLEEVPCNLCGSSDLEDVGEKLGFTIVECLKCGLRFTNPRPNGKAREALYSRDYYFGYRAWLGQQIKSESVIQEGLLAGQQVRNILLYKKRGKLLDVGCSTGELLEAAQKKGFSCWGVEPNKWACSFANKKRGLKVINGELQKFSFESNFFDVVSYMEVIEHIPDPLGELREINRILKNDGILMLSSPNFGCEESHELGIQWKHNKPWEHIYLFDYVHLRKMLDLAGFSIIDVTTELSDGVAYPGGMLVIAGKRNFKPVQKNPRILLIREGARGDVLLTTPVIRALKDKYPRSSIIFKTNFPEILSYNPYLEEIITDADNREYDLIYNLKYELFPEMNYVEAYARTARVKAENPQLEFHLTEEEEEDGEKLLQSLGMERDKLAVLHPMAADRTKSWREERYQHICQYLLTRNYNVITIGGSKDCTELSGAINLIGKTTIRTAATIISKADIFFGIDSFPMHLAYAFGVPSVVLFGPTDPGKVVCSDNTVYPVQSDEKCLGCRHDTTPDRWFQNISCRRDRLYCMMNISSDQAIDAISHVICTRKQNDREYSSHITCRPV